MTATLPTETDVLVVGAGLAGICAAIEAATNGASVLLLEKMSRPGGSSRMSSGFFAFSGTDDQRTANVDDSNERFYDDLRRTGGNANDVSLLRTFIDHQQDGYRWLKALGVTFDTVRATSGQSVPRTHQTVAVRLFELLQNEIRTLPLIQLHHDIAVERLERVDGRVVSVCIRNGSAIRVRRGVILASGGFSQNEDLLRNFAPLQTTAVRLGGAGNSGDGLKMAWALGAGFRDMGCIRGTFGCHPSARDTHDPDAVRMPISAGGIAVNRQCKRFVNESLTYKEIGDACLRQDDGLAFQVFDAAMLAKGSDGIGPLGLRSGIERGWIVSAPTLDALAERLGLDPEGLAAAVVAYNQDVADGQDRQFGRTSLVGGFGVPAAIQAAPFYGFPCTSSVLATYCGLTVDPQARVLDVFGAPIEGLYAAGEITGGFHGSSYMAGSALTKALVFGRIAGQAASKAGEIQ
jgi:fumarate reductase flavoprotein subunit